MFLLAGALPSAQLADRVHDIVVAVIRRIRDGELENPDSLPEFVRSVTREHIVAYMQTHGGSADVLPGDSSADCDSTMLMRQILRELSDHDREALERYYVLGQTETDILEGMQITPGQFRALKAGVKLRFLNANVSKPPRQSRRERVRAR